MFLVLTISSVIDSTLNHQIVSAISMLEIMDFSFSSLALVLIVLNCGSVNFVEAWRYIDSIFFTCGPDSIVLLDLSSSHLESIVEYTKL
jgi:predicted nucleotide-binding protein (sugar kinase/HSP70/actin superfamily)